jgi:hypothetical protein
VIDILLLASRVSVVLAGGQYGAFQILVPIFLPLIAFPSLAHAFDTLPNFSLTPGLARDNLTVQKICRTKWGSDARAVTAKMKQGVKDAYNFDPATCPLLVVRGKRGHYVEIDHLIPRSLGGADDERNLWPQCYERVYKDKSSQDDGAHKKDQLETRLHKDLCQSPSAELLSQYQDGIKYNWISFYHRIYGD